MVNATMDTRLPVTLLSGFLGAGKSTLLENILKKQHNLKIACLINDMAEINIDAQIVGSHRVNQKKQEIVELSNGCICCTLRSDLLEEVAALAQDGRFDYLLIESSGISEPQQVAEAFTLDFYDMLEEEEKSVGKDDEKDKKGLTPEIVKLLQEGGLAKMCRLDTAVTVVDCLTFFDNFDTAQSLVERWGERDVPEEDDRNVTELLVDQIEFSNVIILNKTDLLQAGAATTTRVENIIKQLNPHAKIIRTHHANVDPQELVNTNLFDFDKAATSMGWLESLSKPHTPETLEYNISSVVFRSRKPFHPERLYNLLVNKFVIIESQYEENSEAVSESGDEAMSEAEDEMMEEQPIDIEEKRKTKKADPVWKGLLRSKGFIWLATRPSWYGEWSQAGLMCQIAAGGPWYATMDESDWPFENREAVEAIKADFEVPWGDRRQELVLIGENLQKEDLEQQLRAALVTDKEWRKIERIMKRTDLSERQMEEKLQDMFDDGFESWLPPDGVEPHSHSHSS